jgi:hypothetical protein
LTSIALVYEISMNRQKAAKSETLEIQRGEGGVNLQGESKSHLKHPFAVRPNIAIIEYQIHPDS